MHGRGRPPRRLAPPVLICSAWHGICLLRESCVRAGPAATGCIAWLWRRVGVQPSQRPCAEGRSAVHLYVQRHFIAHQHARSACARCIAACTPPSGVAASGLPPELSTALAAASASLSWPSARGRVGGEATCTHTGHLMQPAPCMHACNRLQMLCSSMKAGCGPCHPCSMAATAATAHAWPAN